MHIAVAESPNDNKHILNSDLKEAQAWDIRLRGILQNPNLKRPASISVSPKSNLNCKNAGTTAGFVSISAVRSPED
jgi:hypothetical protein